MDEEIRKKEVALKHQEDLDKDFNAVHDGREQILNVLIMHYVKGLKAVLDKEEVNIYTVSDGYNVPIITTTWDINNFRGTIKHELKRETPGSLKIYDLLSNNESFEGIYRYNIEFFVNYGINYWRSKERYYAWLNSIK